ncbi:hypothetical protein CDD83_652 [Cordyceps sp. RAO-2017]|nr:hypothetical protein CDD83_652 [Cordyceps sp. RAO-2017]
MEGLVRVLLLLGVLCKGGTATEDCSELECYEDLVFLTGSAPRLFSQCVNGALTQGETVTTYCDATCPAQRCNGREDGVVSVEPAQFKRVCSCVTSKAVPWHCEDLRCYHEMASLAGDSPYRLRRRCLSKQMFGFDSTLTHPKSIFPFEVDCGRPTDDGSEILIGKEDYGPVCECVLGADGSSVRRWPASRAVLGRQDGFEPLFMDAFIHIIVKSSDHVYLSNMPEFFERGFRQTSDELKRLGIIPIVKSVQAIVQPEWALGRDNAGMRESLHQGDNRDLNFYLLVSSNLDDRREMIRPLNASRNTYCSPPFESTAWETKTERETDQDGCISTPFINNTAEVDGAALSRWLGLCEGVGCKELPSQYPDKEVHDSLAKSRFVPTPRDLTRTTSHLKAHDKKQDVCHDMPCYRELKWLLPGPTNLDEHCRFYRQTASPTNLNGDIPFRNASFPFFITCGTVSSDSWLITMKEYLHVCHCAVEYDAPPRQVRTIDVFADADDKLPIVIDVFIHAISASRDGPMARKFHNKAELETEFRRAAAFYKPAMIAFRLKSVDLTVNAIWASGNDSDGMRQSLYAGGTRDLNLYYLEAPDLERAVDTVNATLVFCSFPFSSWWAYLSLSDPEHDGCLVPMRATPGLLAAAMQYWIGVHLPAPRACKEPECGPRFSSEDIGLMRRLLALNRFIPLTSKWARLRLLGIKGI